MADAVLEGAEKSEAGVVLLALGFEVKDYDICWVYERLQGARLVTVKDSLTGGGPRLLADPVTVTVGDPKPQGDPEKYGAKHYPSLSAYLSTLQ